MVNSISITNVHTKVNEQVVLKRPLKENIAIGSSFLFPSDNYTIEVKDIGNSTLSDRVRIIKEKNSNSSSGGGCGGCGAVGGEAALFLLLIFAIVAVVVAIIGTAGLIGAGLGAVLLYDLKNKDDVVKTKHQLIEAYEQKSISTQSLNRSENESKELTAKIENLQSTLSEKTAKIQILENEHNSTKLISKLAKEVSRMEKEISRKERTKSKLINQIELKKTDLDTKDRRYQECEALFLKSLDSQ